MAWVKVECRLSFRDAKKRGLTTSILGPFGYRILPNDAQVGKFSEVLQLGIKEFLPVGVVRLQRDAAMEKVV